MVNNRNLFLNYLKNEEMIHREDQEIDPKS